MFSKDRLSNKPVFSLNDDHLDVVDEFDYLVELRFDFSGKFAQNKKCLIVPVRKAMLAL